MSRYTYTRGWGAAWAVHSQCPLGMLTGGLSLSNTPCMRLCEERAREPQSALSLAQLCGISVSTKLNAVHTHQQSQAVSL